MLCKIRDGCARIGNSATTAYCVNSSSQERSRREFGGRIRGEQELGIDQSEGVPESRKSAEWEMSLHEHKFGLPTAF